MLINSISHISKLRKAFDKQVLPYPLLDRLYKSSQKEVRQVPRIDLRVSRILALKVAATASKGNQADQTTSISSIVISNVSYVNKIRSIKLIKKKLRLLSKITNLKPLRKKVFKENSQNRIATTLTKISITISLVQKIRLSNILPRLYLSSLSAIDTDAVTSPFHSRIIFTVISIMLA